MEIHAICAQEDVLMALINAYFPELHLSSFRYRGDPNIAESYHDLSAHFNIDFAKEVVSFNLVKKRILEMLEGELKFIQETIQKVKEVKEKAEGEKSDAGSTNGE